MGRVSPAGLDLIKRYEGLSLKAYVCPAGVLTIGYGHTKGVIEGMEITSEEAEALLRADLADAEEAVNRLCPDLTQGQFDALVSFVFNLGAGKFAGSTLFRKIQERDYLGAALEFPKWRFSTGKPMKGLLRRRFAEGELFLS